MSQLDAWPSTLVMLLGSTQSPAWAGGKPGGERQQAARQAHLLCRLLDSCLFGGWLISHRLVLTLVSRPLQQDSAGCTHTAVASLD